jgi:hypothetical protein
MDVRAVLLVLAVVVVMLVVGTLLARRIFDTYRTPEGDTAASRLLGRSPADYFAQQARPPAVRRRPGPPVADLPRRLAVGGCAAMGFGSLLVWAHLGGPFAPEVFAYHTKPGRVFMGGVVLVGIVVFHQATHGARLPGRLLLVALALPLAGIAAVSVLNPPGVGAAFGAWLSLAGALVLLTGALVALGGSNALPPDP